jgi:hypothetical protein
MMNRKLPLAKMARIEASLTASVAISSDGMVQKIENTVDSRYSQAKSLFGTPVEKVIRRAKFRSECSGKTVRLVFHFNLLGMSPNDLKASTSFGYPNIFWIVAEMPLVQPLQP